MALYVIYVILHICVYDFYVMIYVYVYVLYIVYDNQMFLSDVGSNWIPIKKRHEAAFRISCNYSLECRGRHARESYSIL